jgi:hypothetical protein
MSGYKLEKNLIFYHTGESGPVFTYQAGKVMTETMLRETLDNLRHDTQKRVDWVEERRRIPRDSSHRQ